MFDPYEQYMDLCNELYLSGWLAGQSTICLFLVKDKGGELHICNFIAKSNKTGTCFHIYDNKYFFQYWLCSLKQVSSLVSMTLAWSEAHDITGPSGFRTACRLRECGLARFPFWVARRWGRTAVDVLLSDCQYRKGTALYGQCGVWNTGDSWGGCGLSWAWIL